MPTGRSTATFSCAAGNPCTSSLLLPRDLIEANRKHSRKRVESLPSFEKDIKRLFRESDREEMEFVFDLWSYHDVRANAVRILERLADGTMPCDAAWDDETGKRFRDWTEGGCDP